MRRLASEVIRELERRVARLEGKTSSSKEPRWITWAIETLLESKDTKATSRSQLKTRRNGQVWENYEGRDNVILVASVPDRAEYLIYESDDVKTEMNMEVAEDIMSSLSVAEIVEEYPWMRDVVVSVAALPAGDLRMMVDEIAEQAFEDMDDDELIELAGFEDRLDEYQTELEEWEGRMDQFKFDGSYNPRYSDNAEIMVSDYRDMIERLPEEARSKLFKEKEDEVRTALTQYPFEYLTDDLGYSDEDALNALGMLDRDEAKSAIHQLQASEQAFEHLAPGGSLIRTDRGVPYRIEEL
jgi:hypothetical protein